MHEPLSHPLKSAIPRLMSRAVEGEQGEHARIPISDPLSSVIRHLILDVETVAGGTEVGAYAAAEASFAQPLPEGVLEQPLQSFRYPLDVQPSREGVHGLLCEGFSSVDVGLGGPGKIRRQFHTPGGENLHEVRIAEIGEKEV